MVHICRNVGSPNVKLTATNKLWTPFCEGSTEFASTVDSLCCVLVFDRKPSTVRHVRHPSSIEHTFSIVQFFGHLPKITMTNREKCGILLTVSPGTFRSSARSSGFGGLLNVTRRVDTVCAEFSGSTEATRTSSGADSLAEGCGNGKCVVSDPCTHISLSPLTSRLCLNQGRSQTWCCIKLLWPERTTTA